MNHSSGRLGPFTFEDCLLQELEGIIIRRDHPDGGRVKYPRIRRQFIEMGHGKRRTDFTGKKSTIRMTFGVECREREQKEGDGADRAERWREGGSGYGVGGGNASYSRGEKRR